MNFLKKCKIINLFSVISIVLMITPVEAGRHKNTGHDFEGHTRSRKIKNKHADYQFKKQEEFKKLSASIPYIISHAYNLDLTTYKGMGVGLLLATYVLPGAASLNCKQTNLVKFQSVKEALTQKHLFQDPTCTSGLVIGHDATFPSSEARKELFQWTALRGVKTLYMGDASNTYVQKILTHQRLYPEQYTSLFEEGYPGGPVCKDCSQLRYDWPQVDHAAEIYRADKLNLNIIGIDNYRESKDELYINKRFDDLNLCNKITKNQTFCSSITMDQTFCEKITYDDQDQQFCNRIIALTEKEGFYSSNAMNQNLCAGMHPTIEIRETYMGQALDKEFNKNENDFILVTHSIFMNYFDLYFKNKSRFDVQFVNTGATVDLMAVQQLVTDQKKREKRGICPEGSAENFQDRVNFIMGSRQYHPELCNTVYDK